MIVLWQWNTPSRLTPATSLPSLLVRPPSRTSLSLMVRPVISGYLACYCTGSGDLVFHWKLAICCPSVHRCRSLPLSGTSGDFRGALGGEMLGHSRRPILFKLVAQHLTACLFFDLGFLWHKRFFKIRTLTFLLFVSFLIFLLNAVQPCGLTGVSWEPIVLSVRWCQRSRPALHPRCPGGPSHAPAQRFPCSSGNSGPGYSEQGGSLTIRQIDVDVRKSG